MENDAIRELARNLVGGEISKDKCPTCGNMVGQFNDQLSLREYAISGMCQKCQDEVFDG